MLKDLNALTGPNRRRSLLTSAVIAGLGAFLVSYIFALLDLNGTLRTGLVSDVNSYRDLADSILDGAVPYVDLSFEHLPAMLVPIVGLGWLSDVSGVPLWLVWPMTMTALFAVTAMLVDRLNPRHPAGFAFIAISLPLLPLALFRIETWVVLFAVGAIVAFLAKKNLVGVIATIVGTLAKGWPIAVSILPWKTRQRSAAAWAVVGGGLGLAAVSIQEGFRASRSFEGIHTETVVGGVVLLARHVSGTALETLSTAGATYVSVPSWALALNAIPGALVLSVVIVLLRRPLKTDEVVSLLGLTVLGIVLVSPLFSTQFLVWLAPFVAALAYRNKLLYVLAGLFAFASVAVFDPSSPLWALEIVVSNVAVLALAVSWAHALIIDTRTVQPVSTSRKNLPV
jgi:hypothetical protein